MKYDKSNIFAKILRGEIPCQKRAENDHALAFDDIAPSAPVHILVIPKGPYVSFDHFARDASEAEITGFHRLIADITANLPEGFRAITNAREHGVQEVPHFHMHILAGRPMGPMIMPPADNS